MIATPIIGAITRIAEGISIGSSSAMGEGDAGNADPGKVLGLGVGEGEGLGGVGEFVGEGLGLDGRNMFGILGAGPGTVAVVMSASSE